MERAVFYLRQVGVSKRFKFFLEDKEGRCWLQGQYREQKPMCINEMEWIKKIAEKDNFYERIKKDEGYVYILRANDAHELGRGNIQPTEDLMNEEINFIKQHAADATFVDETPEEERIFVRDYIVEESTKVLHELGREYE